MKRTLKIKPTTAFATYRPGYGLNPYWIRAEARQIRTESGNWKRLHKAGWRVVKVKVTAIGRPI